MPGNQLFVAGFSYATTEDDLTRAFSHFGKILECRCVKDERYELKLLS